MLELTHNHGQTEPYDKGNGYSHIAFTVDDLEGTVARLQEGGVKLTVEPKTMAVDGHDYRIAFVEDPDGYRVELVERGTMKVGDMIQWGFDEALLTAKGLREFLTDALQHPRGT
jgi:lactoylglutathione lyase